MRKLWRRIEILRHILLMKSMTGYGRGESSHSGFKVTVEISSVNRKQSEISVNLPRELEVLEAQVREEVNKKTARGRITVRVTTHSADGKPHVHLNEALAKSYAKAFTKLAKDLKISADVDLDTILKAPGVLQTDSDLIEAEEYWPTLEKALLSSLNSLVKMRTREGSHLAEDLKKRVRTMKEATQRVKTHAPKVAERYKEQLRERIKNAGLDLPEDEDERLRKEVIYFADRSDISEELTRLESHFQQFDDCMKSTEPIGRTLDFLSQEMNREINTVGSKANDILISREVVVLKAELEKFREQVQNVE